MKKSLIILAIVLCSLMASLSVAELTSTWRLEAPQWLSSVTIASYQLGGTVLGANVVEITTTGAHNFKHGDPVVIVTGNTVIDSTLYTNNLITAIPTATTFRYAKTAGNIALTAIAGAGTAKVPWFGWGNENRGITYNPDTTHILVARGSGTTTSWGGVHIISSVNGSDIGELKMGADITSRSLTLNVARIETTQPHRLMLGQGVRVSFNPPNPVFDGFQTVTNIVNANKFDFAKTNANVAPATAVGALNITYGSYYNLIKVRATTGGAIIASNLTIQTTHATDVLQIYYWASETAVPYCIFRNNASDSAAVVTGTFVIGPRLPNAYDAAGYFAYGGSTIRLGDVMDAAGDGGSPENIQIFFSKAGQGYTLHTDKVYKLAFQAGASAVSTATEINLENAPVLGNGSIGGAVSVNQFNPTKIWISNSIETAAYTYNSGTTKWDRSTTLSYPFAGYFTSGALIYNCGGRGITYSGKDYYVYNAIAPGPGHPDASTGYNVAIVADVTNGFHNAKIIDLTPPRSSVVKYNTNGTGDVDVKIGGGKFVAMSTMQFIGVFNLPSGTAANKYWTGAADSDWFNAGNWSPASVPTAYDDVKLNHTAPCPAGAYTVKLASEKAAICRTLQIDGESGAKVALKLTSEGKNCGTPAMVNGTGLSDIAVSGTFRTGVPTVKDDSMKPRYRVEIVKGTVPISRKAITTNVATITTAIAHNFVLGDVVVVTGVDGIFNGTVTLTAGSGTTFSYAVTNADIAVVDCGGSAKINGPDQFRWNNINSTATFANGGAGVYEQSGATNVVMTGAAQAISDGFSVTFTLTTGHNTGDAWIFNPLTTGNAIIVSGNDSTADYDVAVANNGHIENYCTARGAFMPACLDWIGGGNKVIFGGNGNYVHGTSLSFGNSFPSDDPSYPVYSGLVTWDPGSNYITDIFGAPANFPSIYRSYRFGNVICRNSFNAVMPTAAYTNTVNDTSLICNNLICEANTSFAVQTMEPAALTVSAKQIAGNMALVTCSPAPNGNFYAFQNANVSLGVADPLFDGACIANNVDASKIVYKKINTNIASTPTTGTVTNTSAPFFIKVQGNVTNQGSGALSLDGQSGSVVGVTFNGTTTISRTGTGTFVLPTGFTVNATKTATLDMPLTLTKRGSISGTFNANSNNLTVNDTANGGLQVKNGGILNCSDQAIGGTGALSVEAGGTVNIKNTLGMNGQITVAGTQNFGTGGKFIFSGSAIQVTGASFPATVDSLTISNATAMSGPIEVTNALNIGAELSTGGNELYVSNALNSAITRTAGSVIGALTRKIDIGNTGDRDYPIGTAGKYVPFKFTITTPPTTAGKLAISTADGQASGVPDTAKAILRTWTITKTNLASLVGSLVFSYLDPGDLGTAVEANLKGERSTGGSTWEHRWATTTVNAGANTATTTGVSTFSLWTLYEDSGTHIRDWMLLKD